MKVCLFANTLSYPEGGGHLWVYLNWALGLRSVGCQVIWLEDTTPSMPAREVQRLVAALKARLARYDLADAVALCSATPEPLPPEAGAGCPDLAAAAEDDLLLDRHYAAQAGLVERFRMPDLVDIDPELTQLWMEEKRRARTR